LRKKIVRESLALWRRHVAEPWRLSLEALPGEHGRFDARQEAAYIARETYSKITHLLRNLSKSSGQSVR